jgi:predicted transcriptional regulator
MRKDSPVVPIWLDFDGSLERMFGIIPGEPNVVVLDTAGQVHSVLSGKLNEQEFQQFVTRVDQIRSASRDDLRVVTRPQETLLR